MRLSTLYTLPLVAVLAAPSARAQPSPEGAPALETHVWLDRGDNPVLQHGETARIYYRTSQDAYAAIFRIDTDGHIWLVFPQDPGTNALVKGNRDYRLILPQSPVWRVSDDPGVGYFFMVASPYPMDFSAFRYDASSGWDLSSVANVVYQDPYVAIDDYVAKLIPGWEQVPYALDFLTYNVGQTYAYPRFLCYDCHEARPFASWDPYNYPCTTYRVVIWDDPYFSPSYRYSGRRVVVARPVVAAPRYSLATRVPGDGWRPLVTTRDAPPRQVVEFKELPTRASATPPRRGSSALAPAPGASATPRRELEPEAGSSRPTLQRRPSERLPVRAPPGGGGAAEPGRPMARPTPQGGASATEPRIVRPPVRAPQPQATPTRPPTRAVPERPSASATPQRAPAPSRSPAPSRAPTIRAAPPSRPSTPPRATGSRPSQGSTARRPTVQARPSPRRPQRR
jgi:Domain of unknown function (DUF4384)